MRTILGLFVIITIVLSVNAESRMAHEGTTYHAYQFTAQNRPVIDGKLNDWSIVPETYDINTEDLYEVGGEMGKSGFGVDLSDINVKVKVGWCPANNSLYIAATTFDNVHLADRPSGSPEIMWMEDSFQVMIDADHMGEQYAHFAGPAEEVNKITCSKAQVYVFAYPTGDGIYQMAYAPGTWFNSLTQGGNPQGNLWFESGFGFEGILGGEGTTTYEIRIGPLFDEINWAGYAESMIHRMVEGQVIGFGITVVDTDTPSRDIYNIDGWYRLWSTSENAEFIYRSKWFSDLYLDKLEKVSVESSTWGRIKAMYR